MRHTGTVKWFNKKKGYGFIARDNTDAQDLFIHYTAVEAAGLDGLKDNQKIEYELATEKGRISAINIKLI